MSPVQAHQVGFSVSSSGNQMQLYLRSKDVITLRWLPSEVLPNYIIKNPNDIKVNIQLFRQRNRPQLSSLPRWEPIDKTLISDLDNTGSANFMVPENLKMGSCFFNQNQLCPVVFSLTVADGTTVNVTGAGKIFLPSGRATPEVGIWSSVAFLQSNTATEASLSEVCQSWSSPPPPESGRNRILEGRLRQIPACPPTQALAEADVQFRREEMGTVFGQLDTGYAEAAIKFYHPEASVCYLQIVMAGRYNSGVVYSCCCSNLYVPVGVECSY